jgi:hypothetical protein
MLTYPDYIFGFNGSIDLLKKIGKFKKIVDILDGGLGMHTTNNTKYLGVIDYNGVRYADGGLPIIPIDLIDGKKWRFYHKKGGNNKYYMPAEHCIRWDKESVSNYKIPKTINLNEDRQGVIVSGISSELSARLAIKGALWESNKAFCFFPKDSKKYPPEFFVGILNSKIYNDITKLFNHTVSLQIRDLNKLPLFDFTNIDVIKIANIVKSVINNKKDNIEYSFSDEQEKINQIINKYI